LKPRKMSFSQF